MLILGRFGYICKHCNENIREDEKCVLKHVRNGVLLGETEGRYNGYGTTKEDELREEQGDLGTFRGHYGNNINNRKNILDSEWYLPDSYSVVGKVETVYKYFMCGKQKVIVNYNQYLAYLKQDVESKLQMNKITTAEYGKLLLSLEADKNKGILLARFNMLPDVPNHILVRGNTYSGIIAYHSICYNRAIKKGTFNLIPSDKDKNQGLGKARKKYL